MNAFTRCVSIIARLRRGFADVLRVPEAMATNADRQAHQAGLRTSKGRGRGAPQVTARDATHVRVASVASRSVKELAATIAPYAATRPKDSRGEPQPRRAKS